MDYKSMSIKENFKFTENNNDKILKQASIMKLNDFVNPLIQD